MARAAAAAAEWYLKIPTVDLMLEGEDESILSLQELLISYRANGVDSGRSGLASSAGLSRSVNAVLGVRASSCKAWLPFQCDLHSTLMVDFVGYFKWLKELHLGKRRKTKKTIPPDLSIQIAEMQISVSLQ